MSEFTDGEMKDMLKAWRPVDMPREPLMPFDEWVALGPEKAAEYIARRRGYTARQQAKLLAIFETFGKANNAEWRLSDMRRERHEKRLAIIRLNRQISDLEEAMNVKTCPECKGTKTVPVTLLGITTRFECPQCNGSGTKAPEAINANSQGT